MKEYEILVLGGGPGGYVAAIKAAQLGAKVALIEEENIGGVCLNWGCIPTKTLLKSASVYKYIMNSKIYGIDIDDINGVSINWTNMQKRKDDVVKKLTNGVKTLLKANGVDTFIGHGEIIDEHTVSVNGENIKTKNLILATGSHPFIPPIDGIEEAHQKGFVVTSRDLLGIKEIPKRLTIIGGGVIGVEFATLFSSLGTEVTIVEMANEILMNVDHDIRKTFGNLLKEMNITIMTKTEAKKVNKDSLEVVIDGKTKMIKTDKILVSVGRKANILGLEPLDLVLDRGNVKTNEKLETSVKGVYAIGDVNGKYMLAHVASAEGIIAVENIMGKNSKIDYKKVPACIYGSPEIGFVGLTEEEARKNGLDIIVSKFPLSANGRALTEGSTNGFIKIVADKVYGEVLGVHILSPNATDMIAEAVTTMELEGTIYDLAKAIHPHPTFSEIMMEAAHGAIDKPIHSL